jgi:hypothetical protein
MSKQHRSAAVAAAASTSQHRGVVAIDESIDALLADLYTESRSMPHVVQLKALMQGKLLDARELVGKMIVGNETEMKLVQDEVNILAQLAAKTQKRIEHREPMHLTNCLQLGFTNPGCLVGPKLPDALLMSFTQRASSSNPADEVLSEHSSPEDDDNDYGHFSDADSEQEQHGFHLHQSPAGSEDEAHDEDYRTDENRKQARRPSPSTARESVDLEDDDGPVNELHELIIQLPELTPQVDEPTRHNQPELEYEPEPEPEYEPEQELEHHANELAEQNDEPMLGPQPEHQLLMAPKPQARSGSRHEVPEEAPKAPKASEEAPKAPKASEEAPKVPKVPKVKKAAAAKVVITQGLTRVRERNGGAGPQAITPVFIPVPVTKHMFKRSEVQKDIQSAILSNSKKFRGFTVKLARAKEYIVVTNMAELLQKGKAMHVTPNNIDITKLKNILCAVQGTAWERNDRLWYLYGLRSMQPTPNELAMVRLQLFVMVFVGEDGKEELTGLPMDHAKDAKCDQVALLVTEDI